MAVERFPIEAGHIMMFARSIGDPNPIYADAEYAAATEVGDDHRAADVRAGERAVRPRLPLRPKIGQPWFGSGQGADRRRREPPGRRRAAAVAAAAARACTPSSTTRTTARCASATCSPRRRARARRGRRRASAPGKLVFSETITEYRDQNGELVVTARGVGVRTEQRRWRADDGAVKASELEVGQTFTAVVVEDLKRTQIVQYAGASGDYNPLHTDEVFATQGRRLPERVRARHADDGHDRPHGHRPRRRRAAHRASAAGSRRRCSRATTSRPPRRSRPMRRRATASRWSSCRCAR